MTSRSKFYFLYSAILALFFSAGIYIGRADLVRIYQSYKSKPIVLLVENSSLAPKEFTDSIEKKFNFKIEIRVAQDSDQFIEQSPAADILFARTSWIEKAELHLSRPNANLSLQDKLQRSLSADFYAATLSSENVFPLLWSIPLIRIPKLSTAPQNLDTLELLKLTGQNLWPYWGLEEFLSEKPMTINSFKQNQAGENSKKINWWIVPSSKISQDFESQTKEFVLKRKTKIFVVSLAFVENDHLSNSEREDFLSYLIDPHFAAFVAKKTGLATTVVQSEELLDPWQRASSLRLLKLDKVTLEQ